MAEIKLRAEGKTDQGLKRRVNQDSLRLQDPGPGQTHGLYIVADGVGGNLPAGEVASQTAAQAMHEYFFGQSDRKELLPRVQESIQGAHQAVREKAWEIGQDRIGTTLAGMAISTGGQAVVFNVGDSRVYRIRDNQMERISVDQVSTDTSEFVIDETAKRSNRISSYLGQPDQLEPKYSRIVVNPGDVYVICSDGLWAKLDATVIRDVVLRLAPTTALERLIELVYQKGASDNITALLIHVDEGDEAPRRQPSGSSGRMVGIIATVVVVALLAIGGFLLSQGVLSNDSGAQVADAPEATEERIEVSLLDDSAETSEAVAAAAETEAATNTDEPTRTPAVTSTDRPTRTSAPTDTDEPTDTPAPTNTDEATATNSPTPTPTATATVGGVQAVSIADLGANIRTGPGSNYARLGNLATGSSATIVGFATASTGDRWFAIQMPDDEDTIGWVLGSLIRIEGDEDSLSPFPTPTSQPSGSITSGGGTSGGTTGGGTSGQSNPTAAPAPVQPTAPPAAPNEFPTVVINPGG